MTIEFNVNESTEMDFDLNVAGADPRDLLARFFINMNEMSLVFPAKIDNGIITIKVPALDSFIKTGLNEGELYNAKLEVLADETTLIPWEGQIKIKRPVEVKVKMSEMKNVIEDLKLDIKLGDPKIKEQKTVKKIEEKKEEKKKEEKRKSKLAERFK